jgi:hypothetical protein
MPIFPILCFRFKTPLPRRLNPRISTGVATSPPVHTSPTMSLTRHTRRRMSCYRGERGDHKDQTSMGLGRCGEASAIQTPEQSPRQSLQACRLL